jgi:protein-tyrosine phosphatase
LQADAPESARPGASTRPTRLLFVCLGNICRSPTAEGVMRALVRSAGLEDRVHVDSAGTGSWHVGSGPDERAAAAAEERGIALAGRARQVRREDLSDFDLLLAMDRSNLEALQALAGSEEERSRVRLLREFDPAAAASGDLDVPDPYYGAANGFEEVLDLVTAACSGLLAEIEAGRAP